MQLDLEYHRGEDGRPEGTVAHAPGGTPKSFVGTIELLRLLEDAADEDADTASLIRE